MVPRGMIEAGLWLVRPGSILGVVAGINPGPRDRPPGRVGALATMSGPATEDPFLAARRRVVLSGVRSTVGLCDCLFH